MLAVLDPLLFGGVVPVRVTTLQEVVRILRLTGARIPDNFYWRRLQRECIRPISRGGSREVCDALDAIRGFAAKIRLPEIPPRVTVWGFRAMFTHAGSEWVDVMAGTATGCVLTGEDVLLITRLINGRNAEEHSGPGDCRLIEKTCWDLRVQVPSRALRRIPAVCSRRNVSISWTTRLDHRLPAQEDGATFPYCPPNDWFKSSVEVCETHQGRPAWIDAQDNHWACPATGFGYHWDVYLEAGLASSYGLGQLNVVRWGAPPDEGDVGALHHVPQGKRSRLKSTTGWKC